MRTLPSQPFTRQIDVVATSHRAPLAAFAASVKRLTASRVLLLPDVYKRQAYIPIGRIVRTGGIAACLAYYDKLGPEFSEQIRSMLVFDALIYNEDRHFGNFGVLRDNHSGNIIEMCIRDRCGTVSKSCAPKPPANGVSGRKTPTAAM